MACYVDEEEQLWKCLKHPSNRRRTGICPTCLRERLLTLLCPECSSTRPCSCYPHHFVAEEAIPIPMSTLIENEPAFRKSRSLAVPIGPGSRSKEEFVDAEKKNLRNASRTKTNFWSVFKTGKTRKYDVINEESTNNDASGAKEDYSRMMRSRSVAVGAGDSFVTTRTKRRGWFLPSPMKAFRKTSKLQAVTNPEMISRGFIS